MLPGRAHVHAVPDENVAAPLAGLGEAHAAEGAREGLVARVDARVHVQVRALVEGGRAHVALVGPLVGVAAPVSQQVARVGEGGPARPALVRLLARVRARVLLERVLGRQVLGAHRALEQRRRHQQHLGIST